MLEVAAGSNASFQKPLLFIRVTVNFVLGVKENVPFWPLFIRRYVKMSAFP
jgi:hypothetical protein